jgi:hypothetical protein
MERRQPLITGTLAQRPPADEIGRLENAMASSQSDTLRSRRGLPRPVYIASPG